MKIKIGDYPRPAASPWHVIDYKNRNTFPPKEKIVLIADGRKVGFDKVFGDFIWDSEKLGEYRWTHWAEIYPPEGK